MEELRARHLHGGAYLPLDLVRDRGLSAALQIRARLCLHEAQPLRSCDHNDTKRPMMLRIAPGVEMNEAMQHISNANKARIIVPIVLISGARSVP